jgi:hypothetical protein
MSKRKGARTRKARSASKVRSKTTRIRITGHQQTRANSKQARVLALMRGACRLPAALIGQRSDERPT